MTLANLFEKRYSFVFSKSKLIFKNMGELTFDTWFAAFTAHAKTLGYTGEIDQDAQEAAFDNGDTAEEAASAFVESQNNHPE